MTAGAAFDVFLSYSRADATAADQLRTRLAEAGLRTFLDRYSLPGGKPWQPELETALGHCRALVVLLGPAGIGGWQHREIQLGLVRQGAAEKTATPFPVIPVLLPNLQPDDVPLGTFLNLNTWVDLRPGLDEPEALQRLFAAAQGRAIDGLTRDLASLRPYRGLLPFREQDAGLYFGRQRFIDELVAKVRQRSATNLVAVLGRSGSGKSSIVFAGLFPALRQEKGAGQHAIWQILDLRPGAEPLHALVEAFDPPEPNLSRTQKLALINAGADLLRQRKVSLAQLVRDRLKDDPGTTRLLLYVDQWEELYTQAQKREVKTEDDKAHAADARLFVDLVLDAAATAPCTLVLSARSDFYADIQTHDALRAAVQDCQVSLGPMTAAELTAAIEGPARAVGGSVEPELTKKLLRDIGLDLGGGRDDQHDIGKLPLLEYALEQAWVKSDSGQLSLSHYRGLEQALEDRANKVYNRLPPDQQAAAKRLFVSLVTLGEGQEDTRARVALEPTSELTGAAEAFAASDARLVVTGEEGQRRIVEVSHEALIRHWETLRLWIRENRANLRTRAELIAGRNQWLEHKKDNTLLIPTGLRLETARAFKAQPNDVEIKDLLEYIDSSDVAERAAVEAAESGRLAQHQRELDSARQMAEQERQRAEAEARATEEQRHRADAEAKTAEEQRRRAEAESRTAEEQRHRADAEAARSKTLRRTSILVSIAAVAAAAFGAYAWYAKTIAQERADQTTAALIWARLDFDDLDVPKSAASVEALWDLAGATDAVRNAFLTQLDLGRYQSEILASGPATISRAFGFRPESDTAQRLLRATLEAIQKTTTDAYDIGHLAQAIQSLGPTSEQAEAALRPVLAATESSTLPSQLPPLVAAVQALTPTLTPQQTQAALYPLVHRTSYAASDLFPGLVEVIHALALKLTPEQTQVTLGPVLDDIPKGYTPALYDFSQLAQMVRALRPTPEQTQVTLGPILDAIQEATNSYQFLNRARAVQILGPRSEQTQAALGPVLDAIQNTTDPYKLPDLAQAVQALGPTPEQAQAALRPVLNAIGSVTNPYELPELVGAVQALGPTPEQAQAAIDPVLDAIRRPQGDLAPLAQSIQRLAPKLTPDQAQAALGPVFDAIQKTSNCYDLLALAQAVQALGPKPGQAQTYLGPVLNRIQNETDRLGLRCLIEAVQALGPTPEEAQAALGPVFASTDNVGLLIRSHAVQALMPKLTPMQIRGVIEVRRNILSGAREPYDASAAAWEIATILPADPASSYVAAIVELLKWPTTAEPNVTNTLLEVLHERVPDAPGKEAGLGATVEWVAKTFPEIDLHSPPTFPVSGSTGGAW